MGKLRLQARSAVGEMGTSRDLHCVTQPSNSMAMFSLSHHLSHSPSHFSPKSNRTTYTLQIRHLMHYQCRRWSSFRQNCTDSCKKRNRTKFPFFNPKSFVVQRNLPALRLLMYPYTDSSVCSGKKRKVAAPNICRGCCAASNGDETLIEAKTIVLSEYDCPFYLPFLYAGINSELSYST